MKTWPRYTIEVEPLEDSSKYAYEIRALTRLSDGTCFDRVRRGNDLEVEVSNAISELAHDVRNYLDRTKLPTTPGSVIQSLDSVARYVLGLDGMWHGNSGRWMPETLREIGFRFKVVAS